MLARRSHHHSLAWRVGRAIENAGAKRPVVSRTGPAWVFGLMGVAAEAFLEPLVLAATFGVGLLTYLLLDTPWTRVRAQQRPRFVSVRILYLNTLIVVGFWLAVMFTFSAAAPTVSKGVEQRLPKLLEVATTTDLRSLVNLKHAVLTARSAESPVTEATTSTWFDVFVHGIVSALA